MKRLKNSKASRAHSLVNTTHAQCARAPLKKAGKRDELHACARTRQTDVAKQSARMRPARGRTSQAAHADAHLTINPLRALERLNSDIPRRGGRRKRAQWRRLGPFPTAATHTKFLSTRSKAQCNTIMKRLKKLKTSRAHSLVNTTHAQRARAPLKKAGKRDELHACARTRQTDVAKQSARMRPARGRTSQAAHADAHLYDKAFCPVICAPFFSRASAAAFAADTRERANSGFFKMSDSAEMILVLSVFSISNTHCVSGRS